MEHASGQIDHSARDAGLSNPTVIWSSGRVIRHFLAHFPSNFLEAQNPHLSIPDSLIPRFEIATGAPGAGRLALRGPETVQNVLLLTFLCSAAPVTLLSVVIPLQQTVNSMLRSISPLAPLDSSRTDDVRAIAY